jgi:hypothetical protein
MNRADLAGGADCHLDNSHHPQAGSKTFWLQTRDRRGGHWLLGSVLGSLVGAKAGSGSGGESVTSSITYGGERAAGGPVTHDKAYLVNERGTEILKGASGTVLSNSQSRKMLEGASGGNHYYSIDARGTDPVLTKQRARVAIMAAHNSAVGTGFQVQQEPEAHAAEVKVQHAGTCQVSE